MFLKLSSKLSFFMNQFLNLWFYLPNIQKNKNILDET